MDKFMTTAQLKKIKARIDLLKVEEQKQRELDEQYHKKMYDARQLWQCLQVERELLESVVVFYSRNDLLFARLAADKSCSYRGDCVLVSGHGGAHRFK